MLHLPLPARPLLPALLLLSAAPLPATAQPAHPKSLVLALKPNKNPEAMLAEKQALAQTLTPLLKTPVTVLIPSSNAVIIEGFLNGTIDLAFLSAMEALVAKSQNAGDILLAVDLNGRASYESVWLVRNGDPRASIADFKNTPVAFASRTSTSGALIPHADLVRRGLLPKGSPPEAFFGKGNVFYGSGYVSAVERLLDGQADAAAVSDYVFEGAKHLTPEQKARLRVLQRQGPVPSHVIAVRSGLSESHRSALLEALLKLNDSDGETARLRDQVFGGRLARADAASHLAPLSEALDLTGAADTLGTGRAQ